MTVESPDVLISNFSVNFNTSVNRINVAVDNTYQLQPTIYPSNATNKKINWESSNPSVATVDANGCIRAKSPGSIVITGTADDGSGVTKDIAVWVQFQSEVLSPGTEINLKVGESVYVKHLVRGMLDETDYQPVCNGSDAVEWDRSYFKREQVEFDGEYYTYIFTFKYDAIGVGTNKVGLYSSESFNEWVTINVSQ